jgi:endonuclease YncB( thermonuclease family)
VSSHRNETFNAAWLIVAAFTVSGCSSRQPGADPPAYRGARVVRVSDITFDDGDTFEIKGRPIRVLGIDAPEIAHPDLGIHEGQPCGTEAADSTRSWLSRARTIEVAFGGRDIYDRKLAHVFVDGELLSCRLLSHGLAYETVSHFGDGGFPDLAQQILDVSRSAPEPSFEPPHEWKKKHRPGAKRRHARSRNSTGAPGRESPLVEP